MMSSFVYATTSMFAGQCRVLMFMLGVHNTDKLQAGKKTLTWIQKEVVQPRLCSSLSRCAPWNRTLTQTFRQLQVRQLVISEIGNIYASMCFLGRCPTFCPVSMLVVPVLRWDLAKPMIKFLGVGSRQQHSWVLKPQALPNPFASPQTCSKTSD